MCVVAVKNIKGYGWVGAKNRDRNYDTSVEIVRSTREDLQRIYIDDKLSRWTEGLNEYGVSILSASFSVKSDEKEGEDIRDRRLAMRSRENYYSPDGRAIRKALFEKTPEAAAKKLIAHELAGATYIFTKDKCYLLEGGFKVRKEGATKENPRVYEYVLEEIKKEDCSCRTNHGISIPALGYMQDADDEDIDLARRSSESRYKIVSDSISKEMKNPSELLDALSICPHKDTFMNPIRLGDVKKKEMTTTGQLLLVPAERTLHYRPLNSSVNFSYNKINGPDAKVFFEIVSSRKLLAFREFYQQIRENGICKPNIQLAT